MPQQSPARLARAAALAGGLTLLLTATACGGDADGAAKKDEPTPTTVTAAAAAGVVAPAKVEVIAGLTGCTAAIRIEAAELRQGVCHAEGADYLITTFPEERHKETWLDAAAIYGGRYLVGSRWVVSAEPETLTRFQPKLGGEIRQLGAGAGPSAAPGAS
ncbi:hypothetical protein ACWGH3_00125 [Streptomyces sp. NPDC054884]|uniref:hypothetical protein n=1 Tax=Streptomyces sp. ME08-AFT2 TaxID=3028683 RepID=UPI0029B1E585|nr:hypothetical protein [Streptomyces sp. ME08-AFT2]MDX3311769.1 hypothetical protein [Streptomyces sp. ME08-AFT2]